MVASPKPSLDIQQPTYDEFAAFFAQLSKAAANGPRTGDGPPPPPSAEKTIHNEITKLKANTVNATAIAFFIGGGIAPLVGIGVTGFTVLQAVLGLVWFFVGLVLHSAAQIVLRELLP